MINNTNISIRIEESNITNAEVFNRLYKLHQILIADEVFKEYTPLDFHNFKKAYSTPKLLNAFFEALSNDEIYKQVVPSSFAKAIVKYNIFNHFNYRGIINNGFLIKSKREFVSIEVKDKLNLLKSQKEKLHSDKLSSENQKEFTLKFLLIIFIISFLIRYLIYSIRWSIKVLKS